MALIHYYKFNGNLFDSIGSFHLLADIGNPYYISQIGAKVLGSGLVYGTAYKVFSSFAFSSLSCFVTGLQPNAFGATTTSNSYTGLEDWSMTGWVSCSATTSTIVNLLTLEEGQSPAELYYDSAVGGLIFNDTSRSCSANQWVFFVIRISGTTCYFSVNGGSEISSAWNSGEATPNRTLINGIRIGDSACFFELDDLRFYNHSLSSGEISSIYNSNNPYEANFSQPIWQSPIHHYKFENNLNDSVGSDNAGMYDTASFFSGSLRVAGSNTLARFASSNTATYSPSSPWSSESWCVTFDIYAAGSYYETGNALNFSIVDLQGRSSSGYAWTLDPIYGDALVELNLYGVYAFMFDHISKRFLIIKQTDNKVVYQSNAINSATLNGFSFPAYGRYYEIEIDDLRIYNKNFSEHDLSVLFLNRGREISSPVGYVTGFGGSDFTPVVITSFQGVASGSPPGSASGNIGNITVSPFTGTAVFTPMGAASGPLATITVSGISASVTTGNTAFGSLPSIVVSGISGNVSISRIASGSLATVTIASIAGLAFPEFIATGSLSTVSIITFEAVVSISTSIQLSYCACDAEIGWQQSLPITGFVSAVQGEDAISARITPVVSGIDANIVFFEQRTLTASSSYTYDLRSLTDFLGQSFSLSRAYAISVVMTSGSATISPGASNPLQWFFNSTTANVTITSGNSFMFAQKGSAIVSNSAKTILVTNPSALSACVYKIAILGGR